MCKDEKKQGQNTFEYKAEGNKYVFVGNLEEYLRGIGVDPEHIKDMQHKKLQNNRNSYYNSCGTTEMKLVPLEKVIGTSRGAVGKSIFDNVREISKESNDGEQYSPLDESQFRECFSSVDRLGLEGVRHSYKTASTETSKDIKRYIRMDYYREDDKYFVNVGSHRTLTAMLLGAPSIEAEVTTFKCDWEMKHKVESKKAFYKEYSIDGIYKENQKYVIVFRGENGLYRIKGFESRREGESFLEIMGRLQHEIEGDLKLVSRIKHLPVLPAPLDQFWVKFFTFANKNERIPQYFECNELSKQDKINYNTYSVTLEDFAYLSEKATWQAKV